MTKIKENNWFLAYVYFYLFVTPWHFSKSQLSILSAILLLWSIIKFKKDFLYRLKEFLFFTPTILLFLFILYSYISVLWSEPIKDGLEHVNNFYKYYLLLIPAILVSLNKESALTGIKILIFSFGLYSLYSILIYFGFFNSDVYGFQSNNPTGHLRYLVSTQYMVIAFFCGAIFFYYLKSTKIKILFLLVSLLSFFALFVNNSRTSQLAFFLIFLIFAAIFMKKYIFNLKAIAIFLVIVISSIYFLYENNKLQRYKTAYNEIKNVFISDTYIGSLGVRLYFNKTGFEIFKQNFIFGTGPLDNRKLLENKQKNDPKYLGDNGKKRIINHFHSEHIDTLTAYGIVGYILIFSSIVILIYKLRTQSLYFYSSLVVFLSLFFNSFANKTLSIKPLNYVYIIFFILFAIIALKNKKEEGAI